jgi:type 2 lantibiotic biosynthesis protein LanM
MTVAERVELLRSNETSARFLETPWARERLKRWSSQRVFHAGDPFTAPPQLHGCTRNEFLSVIDEPESLSATLTQKPGWLLTVESSGTKKSELEPSRLLRDAPASADFLIALQPLIAESVEKLEDFATALTGGSGGGPVSVEHVGGALFVTAAMDLVAMLTKVMTLELHASRLNGALEGDSSMERFGRFVESFRNHERRVQLLTEYPVLARLAAIRLDDWVGTSCEFLEHLVRDWEALVETFDIDPDAFLAGVSLRGDRHRGCRAVIVADFTDGTSVVYKPRSIAVELHFQELLGWINEKGLRVPFRQLNLLNRGSYGWVEFVETQPCQTHSEVQRFYRRHGGYLALLHSLAAVDFHSENVIAEGEHPILVDLEALFHHFTRHELLAELGPAEREVEEQASCSVLRIGLLPTPMFAQDGGGGVDISGLGARPGQRLPVAFSQIEDEGTDEMRYVVEDGETPEGLNRPALSGRDLRLDDFVDEIEDGFDEVYRLLVFHRADLLRKEGPIYAFAKDSVRCILRSTLSYVLLLDSSYHPHFLRDAVDREERWDRMLSGPPTGRISSRAALKIVQAERADLWRGDVPMFTTRPDSRDVWTSAGDRIPRFFPESGLDVVSRRLDALSDDDLKYQRWLIRSSIGSSTASTSHSSELIRLPRPLQLTDASARQDALLGAAIEIGDGLEESCASVEGHAAWLGITSMNGTDWAVNGLGPSVHDGHDGIAFFLAYLGQITGQTRFSRLARAALETAGFQILRDVEEFPIGAFAGSAGHVYVLTHLAMVFDEPKLLRDAIALVNAVRPKIESDTYADILAGSAGFVMSSLGLHAATGEASVLAAATDAGDHLLETATQMPVGIGWTTPISKIPLAGLSHGAAGIAMALFELAAVTGNDAYRRGAIASLEYERTVFNEKVGNWRDLREDHELATHATRVGDDTFLTFWCHGAAGIGLARLRSLAVWSDELSRVEIDAAIRAIFADGFGFGHSLCHGDLGNLDILQFAADALDDSSLRAAIGRIANCVLESVETEGWLSGLPLNKLQTPGLMLGHAGMGYGLLRLAYPRLVPCVLALDLPRLVAPAAPTDARILDREGATSGAGAARSSSSL